MAPDGHYQLNHTPNNKPFVGAPPSETPSEYLQTTGLPLGWGLWPVKTQRRAVSSCLWCESFDRTRQGTWTG